MELLHWFFYTKDDKGKKDIKSTKVCKSPERAKDYKSLEALFNSGKIHGFGYTCELDSIVPIGSKIVVRDMKKHPIFEDYSNNWAEEAGLQIGQSVTVDDVEGNCVKVNGSGYWCPINHFIAP